MIDQVLGDMIDALPRAGAAAARAPRTRRELEFTTLLTARTMNHLQQRPPPGAAVSAAAASRHARRAASCACWRSCTRAWCRPTTAGRAGGGAAPSGRPSTTWSRALRGARPRGAACSGIGGDLGPLRSAVEDFKPHIAFNLLEAFDDVLDLGRERRRVPRAAEGALHRLQLARAAAGARQGARQEAALLPPHAASPTSRVFPRDRTRAGGRAGCASR